MGLPEEVADLMADADMGASREGLADDDRQFSALIGRPTTPLRQMIEQAISAAWHRNAAGERGAPHACVPKKEQRARRRGAFSESKV